jgi:hypothetical protein
MRLFGPGVMEATNIMTMRGETMINTWFKRITDGVQCGRTISAASIG